MDLEFTPSLFSDFEDCTSTCNSAETEQTRHRNNALFSEERLLPDQYDRSDADSSDNAERREKSASSHLKAICLAQEIVIEVLKKGRFAHCKVRALSRTLKKALWIILKKALSQKCIDRLKSSSDKLDVEYLKDKDYRWLADDEKDQKNVKRRDGKKKLIVSNLLKNMKDQFVNNVALHGRKQSTNPRKHVLSTEYNALFFEHYLNPAPIQRKTMVRNFEDEAEVETPIPPKDHDCNKLFSLVSKGGITGEWVRIVEKCPRAIGFIDEMLKLCKPEVAETTYGKKIISMVKGIGRRKNGMQAATEEEFLATVEEKFSGLSSGKLPIPVPIYQHYTELVVEKLKSIKTKILS